MTGRNGTCNLEAEQKGMNNDKNGIFRGLTGGAEW